MRFRQQLVKGGPVVPVPYRNTRAAAGYAAQLLTSGQAVEMYPYGTGLIVRAPRDYEGAERRS